MATQEKTWNVANRMHSQKDSDNPEVNHIITGADEIYDDDKGAKQSDINAQTDAALADRYTKAETYSQQELNSLITTPDVSHVSVVATSGTTAVTDVLPATGTADTIYRIGNWDGTQYDPTVYSLYAWNGTAYVCLAVRSLVGEVYDISVNHPDGQGNPTPYADFAAALGSDGENIPADIRRGGMSIKFVQSSDNKYVQYRYMSSSTAVADFTNAANWQGVDDVPTAGSVNLTESGGTNKFVAEVNSIGKKELSLTGFYGYTTKNGYQLNANGTIEAKTSSKYRIVYTNTPVSKNSILVFTGTCKTDDKLFTIGISSVPITDENITSVQVTILSYKTYPAGDMSETMVVPFDGYIVYYIYTDHWTDLHQIVKNVPVLPDNSVLDVSELNNTNYNSLSEAITAIPIALQKGGMEIRFRRLTPATYTVAKTEGVETQPIGIEVQEALSLESGTYTAAQMTGVTPPESGSVTYYLAVTVDEVTTYTTWVITKATSDDNKYVQCRYMGTEVTGTPNPFLDEANWQGVVDDEPTSGSKNLIESGAIYRALQNVVMKNATVEDIDIDDYPSLKFQILSSLIWGTAKNAKHRIIPVGDIKIFYIHASEEKSAYYAFLTSDYCVSGENAPLVEGTVRYNIPAGESAIVYIPEGCVYLYLLEATTNNNASEYGFLPQGVARIKPFGKDIITALDSFLFQNEAAYDSKNYSIEDTGNFGISSSYKHGVAKVSAGEICIIENSGTDNNVRYAFVTSDESLPGAEIPMVDGTEVKVVPSGKRVYVTIPEGTEYLIWNCAPIYNSRFYKNQTDIINNAITLQTPLSDADAATFRNNIFAAAKDASTIVLKGKGTTFISSIKLPPLDAGVTYRALIVYPYSDIATSNFGLAFYKVVDGTSTRMVGWSSIDVPAYYDITAEEGVDYYSVGGRVKEGETAIIKIVRKDALGANTDEIASIVNETMQSDTKTVKARTIFELNPDMEMLQKMVIAKKKYDSGASGASTIPTLSLAHISDVHGGGTQMARYIEFANHWKQKGYVDELIDTGDVVPNTYSNGAAWRDSIDGIENVITVVGNHDTRADEGEIAAEGYPTGQNMWQYHSSISLDTSKRKDVYNLLMVGPDSTTPYINNWSVVQPYGAADSGLCYFYKDYASQKIRLIGVDAMGYDNVQNTWLQSVLAETLDSNNAAYGYHIVILTHFTGGQMVGLDCNYTSLRATGTDYGSNYNENLYMMPESIDAFQTNGGIFIGYVIGHYHRDMVNVLENYPKQLAFAVSSGGKVTVRDFTKVVGCKSYDDFQIVSINTYDKTVRLIKVGADTDYYMRKKGTLCVGYTLVKDDGTEPGSGETATKVKGVIGEGW